MTAIVCSILFTFFANPLSPSPTFTLEYFYSLHTFDYIDVLFIPFNLILLHACLNGNNGSATNTDDHDQPERARRHRTAVNHQRHDGQGGNGRQPHGPPDITTPELFTAVRQMTGYNHPVGNHREIVVAINLLFPNTPFPVPPVSPSFRELAALLAPRLGGIRTRTDLRAALINYAMPPPPDAAVHAPPPRPPNQPPQALWVNPDPEGPPVVVILPELVIHPPNPPPGDPVIAVEAIAFEQPAAGLLPLAQPNQPSNELPHLTREDLLQKGVYTADDRLQSWTQVCCPTIHPELAVDATHTDEFRDEYGRFPFLLRTFLRAYGRFTRPQGEIRRPACTFANLTVSKSLIEHFRRTVPFSTRIDDHTSTRLYNSLVVFKSTVTIPSWYSTEIFDNTILWYTQDMYNNFQRTHMFMTTVNAPVLPER